MIHRKTSATSAGAPRHVTARRWHGSGNTRTSGYNTHSNRKKSLITNQRLTLPTATLPKPPPEDHRSLLASFLLTSSQQQQRQQATLCVRAWSVMSSPRHLHFPLLLAPCLVCLLSPKKKKKKGLCWDASTISPRASALSPKLPGRPLVNWSPPTTCCRWCIFFYMTFYRYCYVIDSSVTNCIVVTPTVKRRPGGGFDGERACFCKRGF